VICLSDRMETARVRAEQTQAACSQALADAAIARQKATEFEHIQLHVGTFQSSFIVIVII